MADILDELALQIAMLRQDRGWSQHYLALEAGVTRETVNTYEQIGQRRRAGKIATLEKLAAALDMKLIVKLVAKEDQDGS